MIYSDLTKRAMSICFEAHKEQKDKGGMPYVFHPFHLAEQMSTEEEICTALLHDVIEDTAWNLDGLAAEGFPGSVLDALALMTHDESTPYLDYVRELSTNPLAAKVKLADLRHNSTAGRLKAIRQKDTDRLQKYLRSQAILTGGEADLEEMCLRLTYELDAGEGEKIILRAVYEPDGRVRYYILSSAGSSGAQADGSEKADRVKEADNIKEADRVKEADSIKEAESIKEAVSIKEADRVKKADSSTEELVFYDKISLLQEMTNRNLELPESL